MNNQTIKFTTIYLLGILFCFSACKKDNTPNNQNSDHTLELLSESKLPKVLKECSGIEVTSGGDLWMQNDAGNNPILYAVDNDGQLIRSIELLDVKNKDWEDLAQDDAGNLYIGDFGNNDNDRKNLAIFVIPPPSEITADTFIPGVIEFSFEDQFEFPPSDPALLFDTEGFFAANGNLYLFIKDRSKPFIGLTILYELPAQEGTQVAKRIASFSTNDKKSEGAITSADISPDGKMVALLTHDIVWLFSEFTAPQYLSGTLQKMYIPKNRQYEGITFRDNCTILLTNERAESGEVQLSKFNVCR